MLLILPTLQRTCPTPTKKRAFSHTGVISLVSLSVLSSHETVLSTQLHQYTQNPSWFLILEIYYSDLWSQAVDKRKIETKRIANYCSGKKASEIPVYRVREHWCTVKEEGVLHTSKSVSIIPLDNLNRSGQRRFRSRGSRGSVLYRSRPTLSTAA